MNVFSEWEDHIGRALDALLDVVDASDSATKRHRRLREEAAATGSTTRVMRSAFVDRGLTRLAEERSLRTDVLLVCATITEILQLEAAARSMGVGWEPTQGTVGQYFKLGKLGGNCVSAIQLGEIGSHRAEGSAFTCHRARAETGATSVIGVGTAFGIDENAQQVGDVLVATAIFQYDESTVVDQKTGAGVSHRYRADARVPTSRRWLHRFEELRRAGWKHGPTMNMHMGVLLAGAKRVESARFRDDLVRTQVPRGDDPIVGGEMEAAGIAAACRPPAEWAVVKGVSDFGTKASRRRIDITRVPAARAAAECVLEALKGMNK